MSCEPNKLPEIQGHRGFRGMYPENTIIGFEKAAEMGIETLELDVCVSRDLQVVVSHEPYLNGLICTDTVGNSISRENEKSWNLFAMDYSQIRQCDCGNNYHPAFPEQQKIPAYKPRLEDVFNTLNTHFPNIKYNIEIKTLYDQNAIYHPEAEKYVELVLDIINAQPNPHRINLQSFDLGILEEIRKQHESVPVALLVEGIESIDLKLEKLSYRPEIISPYFRLLDSESVNNYQDQGFKVIPWTVNEIEDMKLMIEYGVDAIITDYPDRLKQIYTAI